MFPGTHIVDATLGMYRINCRKKRDRISLRFDLLSTLVVSVHKKNVNGGMDSAVLSCCVRQSFPFECCSFCLTSGAHVFELVLSPSRAEVGPAGELRQPAGKTPCGKSSSTGVVL